MTIIPTDLRNEMSRSYLEYAMSVIVGRALPDARDGLKPVHRRILYAMHELGLTADRPFRKCARVVGEVLGKYHPHGDTAVYDALVRMAQDFSMRSPLIAGHGNFGSVDNDPPAAMRYTECRLQALTENALLQDIEAETVDFIDNFDGSQQEPIVLPARIPQLLLNGSSGIAVGMATNIPPHNLGELIDGVVALIHNPEISDRQLMQYIPGPDFPTGGKILGTSGIHEAFTTGRGSITMRGVAEIETVEQRGRPEREAIIITQLPYQTNKAALIEKIAELVNDKRIEGIADIRDESDRDGMRIVIELKRDAYPRVVLNNLYKQTPLQANFGANMLALVNNEPQLLTLKQFLHVFLEFRVESITRRTRYELRKAEERDHILQGLLIALLNLDEIIAAIRSAADTTTAKQQLIDTHGLSEAQADAILQMQLRRLTALEAEKIRQEHEDLQVQIADLKDILARRERILEIIETEITQIKQAHATPRRTEIEPAEGEFDAIDLIANEKAVILLTEQGYIKRMPLDTFEAQSRATRGKSGTRMKEDDGVDHFLTCCDHDSVLFFSDRGVVYSLKAYQIPVGSRTSRGVPIVQMLPIPKEERITSIVPVSEFTSEEYLVMLTKGGYIKKTELAAFTNIRANGLIAISLEEGDQLRWVRRARVEDSIIIGSRFGMAIHFRTSHEQLRPLGRATRGVKAMKLKEGDELIGMDIIASAVLAASHMEEADPAEAEVEETEIVETETEENGEIANATQGPWVLIVTMAGYGKRVPVSQFKLYNRATKGKIATKFKQNRKFKDKLAALMVVNEGDELMLITTRGIIIRQSTDAIPRQSRSATGVRVQRLDEDDAIAAVALVPSDVSDEAAAC
ncbi:MULTISPECIES: DNA topoisomerase (ATP-hydrolyzing) subunit A [Chroococcidiopsis]|jgi:DNA gyrase subunit A|uniref:DNA gyrase subunit A n=1 Tax=Chroococcidiopsis thermalis (strain PCC 7203) TaxID=251229 RepID=K9TZ55_CHRTP|nr:MULTISPECIES: DNA topoisomerase (ATP-hydrolyzing) subunit A [Chroococcidiopsis]MBE9018737.1 DNA topoisomerase (ATP-hydrolyzing) subunit A [Chroococcidiopsidales cyanobacterium LEGE 13417]PSB49675.1 DNA topoisomerase (ATP-hydrolyzing) subunit A [Cyanosarcina cf. burmensis CCALA 770]AFY88127.1 DNA gyrase subunit A [Chroococcidiopsis thermalis PCC 7203]PSM50538.1 DNA topoisomerase (ATP-hydrolyzing) subunit A [Chroococcidiopsis sp. CCALA 051]URD53046.1 DNA topoisomerase (ATP-hydrolyzing) subuni